jgi:hypothetical protein
VLPSSLLVLQIHVALEKFKELLDFVILLPLLDEVRDCDLAGLREHLPHELLDLLVHDFIGNAEHLETCTDRAVDQEFQLDLLQKFHLVEVEDVEEDWVIAGVQRILSSILVSEKMARPEKS